MADVLVTGIKIGDMPLKGTVSGNEKLPTGDVGDLAVTPNQIKDFTIQEGNLVNQEQLDDAIESVEQTSSGLAGRVQTLEDRTSNVDNTSDLDKPISNATQAALNTKADKVDVDAKLDLKADKDKVVSSFNGLVGDVTLDQSDLVNVGGNFTATPIFQNVPKLTKPDGSSIPEIDSQIQPLVNSLAVHRQGLTPTFDQSYADAIGGYPLNSRVMLDNGDIVQSTIANNVNNPNFDMNGWIKKGDLIEVESISELLAIQNPKDGDVVLALSYYAGENKGGDLFYFDSTKILTNNGVTIFNGWIRDLSDKILTTDDAGLKGDGSDSNVTTRLQAIADAVSDGFAIKFIGNYKVSTSIYFNDKKSLKLSSINGKVEGDKGAWSWGAQINGTNRRGIFVFKDCPDLDIARLSVKGIQKNIFGSFQDGDSCIQLINCFNPSIRLCTLTNSFAWAIVGEGCEFPVVEYNVIADVVHQSGVNVIVGGGKNAKVNFNHITNCGLYGIEFETYTQLNDDTFEATGNIIDNCFAGITATGGGVTKGNITGNSISKSGYSALFMKSISNAKNISIFNNPCDQNYRGAVFNVSPNTVFASNPISGRAKSDLYLKINPDYFVLKVLDANNFLIHLDAVTNTGTIYIDSIAYTVTAIATYSDPTSEFELSTLRKVTVSQTINDSLVLNKHLQRKILSGATTEANITMLEASDNLIVKENILSGGAYCIYYDQAGAPSGTPKQYVYDNEMLDFGVNAILHTKSTDHVFYRGNKTSSTAIATYNIHADLIKNGSFATKSLKMVDCATQTSSVKPTNRFGTHKAELIVGIYASFFGGTTTGSVAISLNSGSAIITSDGVGAPLAGRMFTMNVVLQKGINSLGFVDTVGDLEFTSAYADLLVPA